MDTKRFDRLSRHFAQRRLTRRQALAQGGAGLAAGAAVAAGLTAATAAQDATPAADDGSGAPSMLFVQSFQSGTIVPTEGVDGRYTVTLEHGLGQTIYFSDRPERIVGTETTPDFLEGMPFLPDNPPNAALVVETADGETDIAVVELYNPLYDPVTRGVTYEVEVLEEWEDSLEMGFQEAPSDLAALAPSFGTAQLFIDDCPSSDIWCIAKAGNPYNQRGNDFGTISANAGMCWNYSLCQPCEPYGHTFPSYCAGYDYWRDQCNQSTGSCGGGDGCAPQWSWVMPLCS